MNTEVSSAEKDDACYISVASERNLRRVRFLKETDDSYYRGLVATFGGSGLLFVHVTHVSLLTNSRPLSANETFIIRVISLFPETTPT